jgi:hypothetical protein
LGQAQAPNVFTFFSSLQSGRLYLWAAENETRRVREALGITRNLCNAERQRLPGTKS